ncbi:MAG: helix-turn-helix domain-containing protein [Anaerohalosphaeraceae bacterium]|nr:helix-turn-helix domain-containing protein [Anaerohalosphaeraceae bacterium]
MNQTTNIFLKAVNMPGMFYTLEEVMEKLGKSEDQVRDFVRQGKLREFRDGAKQLYKVEDVDAIGAQSAGDVSILDDSLEVSIDETGEITLAPEELQALSAEPADDSSGLDSGLLKLDETGALVADEELGNFSLEDTQSKLDAPQGDTKTEASVSSSDDEPDEVSLASGGQDILEVPQEDDDALISEDTKLSATTGSSINILGDTDPEFRLSDDTIGETKIISSEGGSLDDGGFGNEEELSVARLDDDVNLDSFGGSGSGLLDLSLQADDTSLGAVLDDIYPESGQPGANDQGQSPAAGMGFEVEADEMMAQAVEPGSVETIDETESVSSMPMAKAIYAQDVPDTSSNVFGVMLFLPLIASVYASIVVLSTLMPIAELKILSSVQDIIWYIIAGTAGAVFLMAIIASVTASGGNAKAKPKKARAPKAKKEKKTNAKKSKKVKKGKKAADDYQ